MYGIDRISTKVRDIDLTEVMYLFDDLVPEDIKRHAGEIDVLIGFEYAGFHPVREQHADHLLLMSNRFGKCLGGSHPKLSEGTRKVVKHVTIHHFKGVTLQDFYDTEVMGVNCTPKCGGCKCGKCALGSKHYTLKEERELKLIEEGLTYKGDHWVARYPWKRSPFELPNNYVAVVNKLKHVERRLLRDEKLANVYDDQMKDMLERGVSRKLTKQYMDQYTGPVHYVSHHEVLKPDSASTPCRIVFNASASFKGHILNDYWAKGPDLINNMLGILLRFREGEVAISGDIKKMYHAVKITELDQNSHRYVWRNLQSKREPDNYAMTLVSLGTSQLAT